MKLNPNSSHLRSAFSSGLRCVSLCLLRSGGPEMVESESEEGWFGIMRDIERLYPPCVAPDAALCFPDIRRTLWAPPVPAVTTTMLYVFLDQDLCTDPFLYCLGVGKRLKKIVFVPRIIIFFLRYLKIEGVATLAFFFYSRGALRLAAGATDVFGRQSFLWVKIADVSFMGRLRDSLYSVMKLLIWNFFQKFFKSHKRVRP